MFPFGILSGANRAENAMFWSRSLAKNIVAMGKSINDLQHKVAGTETNTTSRSEISLELAILSLASNCKKRSTYPHYLW